MAEWFLMKNPSADVRDLLFDTAEEMTKLFGISKAEAVARINAQWPGQKFLEDSDIILHEDEYFWSLFIYYNGDVPDWSPTADRSSWTPAPKPLDPKYWTIN
ncbi:hypothetical protein TRICI_004728 [Trichomonascus ciferrii]|uniref:Uncharacterized protein n=1 Tax=Trichomonascus ciferrii TaxID=44093 RepID=A0A642V561_9ASCO|nr:hypothetical protein TRICI_004728 [Trichomonascus ciferrii]